LFAIGWWWILYELPIHFFHIGKRLFKKWVQFGFEFGFNYDGD